MDVKRKPYNETNIGNLPVPSDWKVVKLGDNATLKNGANFSTKDVGNGRLMVNVKDLYDFRPFVKTIDETRVEKIADSYILMDGDILFVRSSLVREGVGFSAMYRDNGEETVYSGFIIRARIESDNIFNPFVAYYLRSGLGRKKIVSLAGTVTITNIGQDALAMLPIPIPPLPEQQKIAEILSTVDEQISTTQAIIDKSKELKKGLMQKLFSEGIGHTEFKDTKIGRIPKDWELLPVGKCILKKKFSVGKLSKKDYFKTGNFPIIDQSKTFIIGYTNRSELLYSGNLPAIIYGDHTNHVKYVDFPFVCGADGVKIIQPLTELDNKFIYYSIFYRKPQSEGYKRHFSILKEKDLCIPPVSEQQKIADILSEADAKIEKEELEKTKLEELKKGLMQQLLTGKKRVKV